MFSHKGIIFRFLRDTGVTNYSGGTSDAAVELRSPLLDSFDLVAVTDTESQHAETYLNTGHTSFLGPIYKLCF